ncbi:glycoside hydrolase 5 family protein [Fodinibius sp. AD559]|uniref:glycoside hydrolase 5 family protein n=1 Tax=Fodinibius sp. AD559 TaxID=3424179 RepID=UPI004046D385
MIKFLAFSLLILMLGECSSSANTNDNNTSPDPNLFVSVRDGNFVVDEQIIKLVGTNAYHLPTYHKINPDVVATSFDAFQEAGINLVRMWGFYDGPPQYENDITLQPEPGVYNEEDLQRLDQVIAQGKEHGIRFVIALVNNWGQLGGVPQYNEWDGNSGGGMSHFINDPDTQQWFRDYISMLLNRVNTVTGVAYKDEPAIFSWEIINEGRLSGGDPAELRDWYQDIAQHIKSIDSNHMVSTGEEGFDDSSLGSWTDGGSFQHPDYSTDSYSNTYVLRANEGTSYVLNTQIPEIDYGTAHWYPSEWGWGTVSQDLFDAQHAWISDHIAIAEAEGKPFLLGEYGFPGWGDERVEQVYNDLWNHAEQTELDGSLLWQFTPTGTKCYEYGGNICWPGGRQDQVLYNEFVDHINAMKTDN